MEVDNKIKLLVIPSAYPRNESEIGGIFVLDYINAVADQCEVTVLDANIKGDRNLEERVTQFGFDTARFSIKPIKGLPMAKMLAYYQMIRKASGFVKLMSEKKFDLIHVHGSTMHGVLAKRIAKKLNIPYVVTEHTGPFSKISDRSSLFNLSKNTIEGAACLLTVSEDLLNQIIGTGIKPKKTVVTYNPVDTELFSLSVKATDRKEFIFVSRYEPYKGGLRVIKAFHSISDKLPEWRLRCIGGGPEFSAMTDYVNQNGLSKRVVIHEQQTKAQIAEHIKNAGVFVFPSEHETFGIVIAEAMSAGLPVVVGNQTAPKEFVSSEYGILIDPKSVDQLSKAMLKLAQDQSAYNATTIRNHVVDRFSFSSFGNRLMKIYQGVLDQN